MDKDLAFISLLVDDISVVNGLHEPIPVATVLRQWAKDYTMFYEYLSAREFPENYSIFVPDFWHIAYGDAKCLAKEDATELWESSVTLRNDARFVEDWTELVIKPHPGTRVGIKAGKVLSTV
jgi:hypothetical protein